MEQSINEYNMPTQVQKMSTQIQRFNKQIQSLSSRILQQNKQSDILTFQCLIINPNSFYRMMCLIPYSKVVYFVCSQILLKHLLKTHQNTSKNKFYQYYISQHGQNLNIENFRHISISFYQTLINAYCQILESPSIKQHLQLKQAIEVVALGLSQLLNVCHQSQRRLVLLIRRFFKNYANDNNCLGFLNYSLFSLVTVKQNYNYQSICLQGLGIKILCLLIDQKQNYSQSKCSQSQFLSYHRIFSNYYILDLSDFAISQAKITFHNFINSQQLSPLQQQYFCNILGLLQRVINFSYQSHHHAIDQERKERIVMFQVYTFPEGLRDFGNDYTFIQQLFNIYQKLAIRNQTLSTGQQGLATHQITRSTCNNIQLILKIYGRIFFLKRFNDIDPFMLKGFHQNKMSILISLLKQVRLSSITHIESIIQIVNQTVSYKNFILDMNLNHNQKPYKTEIKQFLIKIVQFAAYHLKETCWKIFYGQQFGNFKFYNTSNNDQQNIVSDIRLNQLVLSSKIFDLLFSCHKNIIQFFQHNKISQIKQFYQIYFSISDDFLFKLQSQFPKINKLSKNFEFQFQVYKKLIKSLPYFRVRKIQLKPNMLNCPLMLQQEKVKLNSQQNIDYFYYNRLLKNIETVLLSNNQIPQQQLQFLYYFIAIFLEQYSQNQKYYRCWTSQISNIIQKLFSLTVTANFTHFQSIFVFYMQIIKSYGQSSIYGNIIKETISKNQSLITQIVNLSLISNKDKIGLMSFKFHQEIPNIIKSIFKTACLKLSTKNGKQLQSVFLVLQIVQKQFPKSNFTQQFHYLNDFLVKLNQHQLFSKSIKKINDNMSNTLNDKISYRLNDNICYRNRFISLYIKIIKNCKFNFKKQSANIVMLNTILFKPCQMINLNASNLAVYLVGLAQILNSQIQTKTKLFLIDQVLLKLQPYIKDINKNVRKMLTHNVQFYQASGIILQSILQIQQLFNGNSQKQNQLSLKQDLKIKIYDTFFIWVKQLCRQQSQVQTLSKDKKSFSKRLIMIYTQFINLTLINKNLIHPKFIIKQEKTSQSIFQQPEVSQTLQTKTTRQLMKEYCKHFYQLDNQHLLSIYNKIDYKLQYINQWWDQIIIRELAPQINVSFVYSKFIIYGTQYSPHNKTLAELFYKIAYYFQTQLANLQFAHKYLYQDLRIQKHTHNQQIAIIIKQNKQKYVERLVMTWNLKKNTQS